MNKTVVTLGGFSLAGNDTITWSFTTGTRPYTTLMTVHNDVWKKKGMSKLMDGVTELDLLITDGERGIRIQKLYILTEAAGSSPNRTSFIVADKRWKWDRVLVSRDFNITKRTGDRTTVSNVPIPGSVTVDEYQYRRYSMKNGTTKWTPKEAVQEVLEQLEGPEGFHIGSFPIEGGMTGQFSLQNIAFNDSGDVALQRLLNAIPGAQVYVDQDGIVQVFDGADLDAAESHFNSLPPSTWDGQKAEFIHRHAIRPSKVIVYYNREVEAVFEYDDDYGSDTSAQKQQNAPVIENVIPTVDPKTTIANYFDYESGKFIKDAVVPAGTWVPFREWLAAMEKQRVDENLVSWPWTFESIRENWLIGDLDGAFGAAGDTDVDDEGNVAARVSAIKTHFRQTFRISRRYMERVQDIQATRVGVLDPVSGAKALAAVWGQMTIISTTKGQLSSYRKDPDRKGIHRMIDTLPQFKTVSGERVKENLLVKPPLPLAVSMLDRDLGIFRVTFLASPYGLDARHIPSFLQYPDGRILTYTRDLGKQDKLAVGEGFKIENGTNAMLLANRTEFKVMLTLMPGAPNNKRRYHAIEVTADEIRDIFRAEFRIQNGKGPVLEVYVTPNEQTARFAWQDDEPARATLIRLLGLNHDDPSKAGLVDDPKTEDVDESKMLGYLLINGGSQQGSQLREHAKAVAAEAMIPFADNLEGSISTKLPDAGKWVPLRGNMGGVTIHVAAASSAKVSVSHEFPGQQRIVSRLALASDATRLMVWGILRMNQGDK